MMKARVFAIVVERPKCDFCDDPAYFDAQTNISHSWAFLCKVHFRTYGKGLGTGIGQYLLLPDEDAEILTKCADQGVPRSQSEIDTLETFLGLGTRLKYYGAYWFLDSTSQEVK
jgi:hypothetical protein